MELNLQYKCKNQDEEPVFFLLLSAFALSPLVEHPRSRLVLLHTVYLAHTMYCRTWCIWRTWCIGAHIEDSQKTYLATTDLLHAVLRHLNTKSLILRTAPSELADRHLKTKSLILRTAPSELAQVVAVCPVDVPLGRWGCRGRRSPPPESCRCVQSTSLRMSHSSTVRSLCTHSKCRQ